MSQASCRHSFCIKFSFAIEALKLHMLINVAFINFKEMKLLVTNILRRISKPRFETRLIHRFQNWYVNTKISVAAGSLGLK